MKNKTILFIGRFQPFHLGHLFLIKKYSKKCKLIKIVIGSKNISFEKNNPFTSDEREKMIILALTEANIFNYKIYHIKDNKDDIIWRNNIIKKVNSFDILITGNKKVKKLFETLDYEIDYIDEKLNRYRGFSSGRIREDWLNSKKRNALPKSVFKYLKNIKTFERLNEMNSSKKKVHYLLKTNKLTIATAESCTGGSIAKSLINYSGSSVFFMNGVIVYSNKSKIKLLGIKKNIITKYGSISLETTIKMAENIRNISNTNYGIATTGYADILDKESGKIFVVISSDKGLYTKELKIKENSRLKIINSATTKSLNFLFSILKKEIIK